MFDIIHKIFAPELAFLRNAILLGILAGPILGVIGSMVVTRRISSLAGASAHTALGGVGIALFLQRVCGIAWCSGELGAVAGAVAAALLVGLVNIYAKEREDTVIAVVWALGMAVGLLFLDYTPGYVDWQGYLFGNILLISPQSIKMTILLDALVLVPAFIFYNSVLATTFDPVFSRLRGLPVNLIYLLLLVLTALTIVLLINIVGIILVIALLTLPAASAGCFTKHLWSMMLCATLLSWIFVIGGLVASFAFNLPSGPVIVVIAGVVYLLSLCTGKFIKKN
ncbi:MAG: metal ABC transporter permease [Lentisphaeria bacterium]|nr:metal ABC transporter permease [Lentisphaeria bacterium]MBQ7395098.1 metal ABC transporter permease [Lentisphaeria bacterium]